MGKYRKVDPRIWNDAKFRTLSDNAKLVVFFLLTHPHMTAVGAMRATPEGLASELGWSQKGFREAFQEVCEKGIAKHDDEASFVWLPKFLRYNPPESPNVVKAWSSALEMLPECSMYFELLQAVRGYLKGMPEGFQKALPEAFAKTMPNQEQEPEQEQEKNHSSAKADQYPPEFEEAYAALPKRKPSHNKKAAFDAWKARVRQGAKYEDLVAGAQRYAKHIRAKRKEHTEFVLMAATFFGPKEHYLQPWEVDEEDGSGPDDLEVAV